MAFCIKCGKENSDSAKFCTGCGIAIIKSGTVQSEKSIPKDYPSQAWEKKRNKPAIILIAIIAMLALGSASYFIFFKKKKDDDSAVKNKNEVIDVTTIDPPVSKTETISSTSTAALSYTDMNGLLVYRSDCFVIITGSFANETNARDYAASMKKDNYSNTGYLWIPDYPSLSGRQLYATFIGPFQSYADCENNLRSLKVNSRFWYGKKVSYNPEQIEIRIK